MYTNVYYYINKLQVTSTHGCVILHVLQMHGMYAKIRSFPKPKSMNKARS